MQHNNFDIPGYSRSFHRDTNQEHLFLVLDYMPWCLGLFLGHVRITLAWTGRLGAFFNGLSCQPGESRPCPQVCLACHPLWYRIFSYQPSWFRFSALCPLWYETFPYEPYFMFCARRPDEGRPSGWMRARPFVKRENWRWQRWFCFALLFNGTTISSQLYNWTWKSSVFTLSNMKDFFWLGESEYWCLIFVFSEKHRSNHKILKHHNCMVLK